MALMRASASTPKDGSTLYGFRRQRAHVYTNESNNGDWRGVERRYHDKNNRATQDKIGLAGIIAAIDIVGRQQLMLPSAMRPATSASNGRWRAVLRRDALTMRQ